MSKDPYVNYMQYNHYPTMGYNDIAEKMQDQGTLDNANNYFKEQYPEMESMQAPPEFEKGTVGKLAANSALKGAGMGASIGSAIPVIGTAVGAGVGAVVGAAAGWLKGSKLKKAAESDAAEFKASKAKSEAASKERDYRMGQAQKQADYMKTLSSGKLR
jgi:phage tail tape-measure protein